ncbi:T9SS type A sorting domain-containing protein [Flammeovirga agarivorans]|uniref:T9SS type A sorting domain-containing protein n=1 Tax=Flammeovirga agarivorans TaxID=2726742 RepID=A0A7X8SQE0_9BACT|nr:T9SS type A sorting domain-containing protein [Flammeovirga agarivorans]NLR94373.1 T9SS type A sorting domain-containing protein [Flammeovirga agarivorans]
MKKLLLYVLLFWSTQTLYAQNGNYYVEYDENIVETPVYESTLLEEMSGICASRRYPGHFWVHNDSGDDPLLYLIDTLGNVVSHGLINDVNNKDWEDIVAFEKDGKNYLMVAAFGDNNTKRTQYQLVLMEEPEVDLESDTQWNHDIIKEIKYAYNGGETSYNHESLAVDLPNNRIFFVTKRGSAKNTTIYTIPLLIDEDNTIHEPVEIGRADIDAATGMDISYDNHRAIIISVEDMIEYTRNDGETWEEAFAKEAKRIVRPSTGRTEAVCYALNGLDIHIVREGTNHPMFIVRGKKVEIEGESPTTPEDPDEDETPNDGDQDDTDNTDDDQVLSSDVEVLTQLSIYPVPSSDRLFIQMREGTITGYTLHGINGKSIGTKSKIDQKNISIDVYNMEAGIYVLTLTTSLGISKHKIVIQ